MLMCPSQSSDMSYRNKDPKERQPQKARISPAMDRTSSERRSEPRRQLAELDRRTWHLWTVSLAVSLSLALAITTLFYPTIRWNLDRIEVQFGILPQLIFGLLTLVLLSGAYIITKQRELNEMRQFIIATYAATAFPTEKYATDTLTGALDRSTLPDILKRETARAERYDIPLCLLLFDICAFRRINESEGNLAGDLVLKALGQAILQTARQTDIILRYEADRFLCFLPGTERPGGEAFGRRVLAACQRSPRLRGLTLDSGLAVYRAGGDPERVLADAEEALTAGRAAPMVTGGADRLPA
jgi:GGDEF domain-containing protein